MNAIAVISYLTISIAITLGGWRVEIKKLYSKHTKSGTGSLNRPKMEKNDMSPAERNAYAGVRDPQAPSNKEVSPAVKAPSVGRVVHYFPNQEDLKKKLCDPGKSECLPATVVEVYDGLRVTLNVQTSNDENPNVIRRTVGHESDYTHEEKGTVAYWKWPEIK